MDNKGFSGKCCTTSMEMKRPPAIDPEKATSKDKKCPAICPRTPSPWHPDKTRYAIILLVATVTWTILGFAMVFLHIF